MEDINSSLDRIVDKFNDSITHSAPKKLSFEHLNDTLDNSDTVPKKRRLSGGLSNVASFHGTLNSCANSTSVDGTGGDLSLSPWQARNLRFDLIEAKTNISKLQKQIEKETKTRREMESLYENKTTMLKEQCEYSSNKILKLERHTSDLRQREFAAKQETSQLKTELKQLKLEQEETINRLQSQILRVEQEARHKEISMANELNQYRHYADKYEMELDLAREELDAIREQAENYKSRALNYDDMKSAFEKEQQNLEFANSRIKELEAKIDSYNDWKEITINTQTRLQSIPDMEKELEYLRSKNKELHELIGNKLLLEEQAHDYKVRIEKEEGARAEAITLQVKLTHIEQELKEWIKVAQDHCPPNTLVSPLSLRSRIEQLVQKDILMIAEKSTTQLDNKSMLSAMQDLQEKCNIYMKNTEDLNIALKKHKNFKERLQRKLLTVSKERDFYKQLVEHVDKDLTMSNSTTDMQGDAQMRYRVEVLERTLAGYKDMCATLEREMNTMRQQETTIEPVSEGYDNVKKELDSLRLENEKLRRRKEELELELEHRCLRGDFNMTNYKVVHLTNNPAAEAYESTKNVIEKLQAEIERLKRRNKKLEDDNEMTQARVNETTNMTMNFMEINQLRAELESSYSKIKKLKDCYKATTQEFRDMCYMLLGYRVDRIGSNSNYKLSSMYAEGPDDYLNFRLNESNAIELLETPYSATLQPMIESQLAANKSFPAFLSALTLELFQRATITIT